MTNGLANILAKLHHLMLYDIEHSIIQYQYLIISMAIISLICCFHTHQQVVKYLATISMMFIIANFTLGIMLQNVIITTSADEMQPIDLAMTPEVYRYLLNSQLLLGAISCLMLMMALYFMRRQSR
jgi:hypothetical protein